MRRTYFDVLLSKAQQGGDDKDVLDRIEKLIRESEQGSDGSRPMA